MGARDQPTSVLGQELRPVVGGPWGWSTACSPLPRRGLSGPAYLLACGQCRQRYNPTAAGAAGPTGKPRLARPHRRSVPPLGSEASPATPELWPLGCRDRRGWEAGRCWRGRFWGTVFSPGQAAGEAQPGRAPGRCGSQSPPEPRGAAGIQGPTGPTRPRAVSRPGSWVGGCEGGPHVEVVAAKGARPPPREPPR